MSHVFLVGSGVLADTVYKLLSTSNICEVSRQSKLTDKVPAGVSLALVLDDAWRPSVHATAEEVFRPLGLAWLRAFVAFGNGFIGPLVLPQTAGCSQCADLRSLMAEADRREMLGLRMQLSRGANRDAWATRSGLFQMALILTAELGQVLDDETASDLIQNTIRIDLESLEMTRHFILPSAGCPVCGTLSEDSTESAVIALEPNPKLNQDSFRVREMRDFAKKLVHDYFDFDTGLLNGKAHDLISPFAAVSVNLPLMMGDEGTSGRGHSYEECELIAILEGLERYCGLEPRGKRSAVFDSYTNLKKDALNPQRVGLHAKERYAEPNFPFQPLDPDVPIDWVWGYSMTEQRPLLVPQRFAYYSLGCQDGFIYETSNGCALGSSLVEAIFHGILELVERDAFLITWYAQLPLPRIDIPANTDRELKWMMDRIRVVAGYDLHLYNATMEHGIPAVFVIAKNRRSSGMNIHCAAGAHIDPMRAVKGAVHEIAGMLLRFDEKVETEREKYLKMLHDPSRVRHMEDHSMLYGLPEAEPRLAFLLDGKQPVQTFAEAFHPHARHLDLTDDLRDLLTVFKAHHLDVIVVNQTSPEIERNGLYCVKVIIPGMLPMTFGHHLTRLEGLDRVLRVPVELGYTERPLTLAELNPHPHPFA